MLLRYGLLSAIVITIVVSLVPLPTEALEVHEFEEYGVEEPLPEIPPRSLQGGRTDGSAADSIPCRHQLARSGALARPGDGHRLRPRVDLADPGGPLTDPVQRPRSALVARGGSDSRDPH